MLMLHHCKYAYAFWCEVFLMFGIQWVMPKIVATLLFGWRNWLGKHFSKIWNMVPTCLMRLIWREQNTCTFEDTVRFADILKFQLVGTLFQWSRIWGFTHVFPFLIFYFLFVSLLELLVFFHHHEHDVLFMQ